MENLILNPFFIGGSSLSLGKLRGIAQEYDVQLDGQEEQVLRIQGIFENEDEGTRTEWEHPNYGFLNKERKKDFKDFYFFIDDKILSESQSELEDFQVVEKPQQKELKATIVDERMSKQEFQELGLIQKSKN
ncbi:unnamed protein product (macronuclear) [Paramecium tetraurelia]|uniref:Uncharacterized protein n=1 Tax=Paramecium tetraurelia TaxID=5888 RepID=A0DKU4_PARTE|nr:uncharacterized protein GSPATT00039560001 [Paramecium tetraurelia]CAK83661.1 unnamed protein product [Paramecium tetraurelia]|eukprot:XP_001451058.1 hypothetical protein (macronuclear) [Paramecium tetraurelia strain d4-2]